MLRSQVVAGWPRLNVNGYTDLAGKNEVLKLRMSRLSQDTLLCLFDGVIKMAAIHETPEVLHSGVEGESGKYTTTLRDLTGSTPGQQIVNPQAIADIPTRSDQQTLQITTAASNIVTKLKKFGQDSAKFTSAEFSVEMVKGVVKVEFQNQLLGNTA